MNKLNIDHLLTLYRRSDTSRLPDVATSSITDAVQASRQKGIKSLFNPSRPSWLIPVLTASACGIFLLAFFLFSHPIQKDTEIAINISKDKVFLQTARLEKSVKKESQENFVYTGRDGRDVSIKL